MTDIDANRDQGEISAQDLTGRSRLLVNLLARWMGQVAVIISGFVIPRLIDNGLGPTSLGIWDLAWSTVSYFRFLGLGLAGGLNRFVALYTARQDYESLARAISSTSMLQLVFAIATMTIASLVAQYSPEIFGTIDPSDEADTRMLITLLGGSLAIQMLVWPARSILTGLHLWTVNAGITAVGDVLILAGLIVALTSGGGMPSLGLVVILAALATESIRLILARRNCRQKVLMLSAVDSKKMKEMFIFGIKNNLAIMPVMIILQTTALFLAATVGPATLAQFARPMALFRLVRKFLSDYAVLLTPTAGSIQGLGRFDEMQEFFLTSVRTSIAMTLPPVLFLAIYGETLIEFWMGESYVVPGLIHVMAIGFFLPFAQVPAMRILVGLNAHGRIGLYSLGVSILTFVTCLSVAGMVGWTPIVAAVVAGISLSSGPGITVPICASLYLGIGLKQYYKSTFALPLACNLIFGSILLLTRWIKTDVSILWALGSSMLGFAVVAPLYWRFLVGDDVRAAITSSLDRLRSRQRLGRNK